MELQKVQTGGYKKLQKMFIAVLQEVINLVFKELFLWNAREMVI